MAKKQRLSLSETGDLTLEERISLIAQLKKEGEYAYGAGIKIMNNLIHYAKRGIAPNQLDKFYPLRKSSDGKVYTLDLQGWRLIAVR